MRRASITAACIDTNTGLALPSFCQHIRTGTLGVLPINKKKKLIHKNHANIRKVHTPQKPARECRGIFRVLPGALPAASFISRLSLRCSSPGGDQIQIDVGSGGQAGGLASCGALRIRGFKHLEQSWTHALGTSYCWEIAWDIVGSINTNR